MAGVIGVKHELNASALVFTVEFRIPVIVANQCATPNSPDLKNTEMASRAVIRQVASLFGCIACAEHFVVAVDYFAGIVDNVKTIVRFVGSCQPVS